MPTTLPINQVAASSIKLKADCWFQPILDGATVEGYVKLRNPVTFAVGPTAETTTISGTEVDNYGQTLDSQTEAGDTSVSLAMNRIDARNMAVTMLGEHSIVTQTATTISDEVIGAYPDQGFPLAKNKITDATLAFKGVDLTVTASAGFTVGELISNTTVPGEIGYLYSAPDATSLHILLSGDGVVPTATDAIIGADSAATDTASTVLVKNDIPTAVTDYAVINNNIVSFPGTTAIPSGTFKVDYDTPAYTEDKITIGANTITKGAFILSGVNTVNAKKVSVRLRQVNFSPEGLVTLMSAGDTRPEVSLTGVAETPTGQTDPGTISYVDG